MIFILCEVVTLRATDTAINPLLTWQPLNLNCWVLDWSCRSMIKRVNAVSHSNSSSNYCVYKPHSFRGKTGAHAGNTKWMSLSDKEERFYCNFCLPNTKAEWKILAVVIWDWYGFQFITDVIFPSILELVHCIQCKIRPLNEFTRKSIQNLR